MVREAVIVAPERWVLLDLDGTLFDYRAAEHAALVATLTASQLPATASVLATYREINARHWAALEQGATTPERLRVERFAELVTSLGEDPAAAPALAAGYLDALARGTALEPGAEEVVAGLARTHRLAAVTNGLREVQRPRVTASPFAAYLEVLVISEEVGAAKPDPAFLDAAFAAIGDPDPARVTLVGDSLSADIAAAAAYGITSVWYAPDDAVLPPPPAPQPTYRTADLRALPSLLSLGPRE